MIFHYGLNKEINRKPKYIKPDFGLIKGIYNIGISAAIIIEICTIALRIASLGYIFMGFSVAVQGILQSLGYALRPLIISILRLVVFVFPVAYLFTLSDNVNNIVCWTFPIAELLTALFSIVILKKAYKEKIEIIKEKYSIVN